MANGGGPERIYIVRHGEKLGDPGSDSDDGPDLSLQGSARAAALPMLFVPPTPELSCALSTGADNFTAQYSKNNLTGQAPRFSTPAFLFATKASAASNRPVETITPLSLALGLPCNDTYADDDQSMTALATEIRTQPAYVGKIVLICWHHGKIPDLAGKLGVANPPKWHKTVFDRVWEIVYSQGSAALNDHPQQLLYGDSQQ